MKLKHEVISCKNICNFKKYSIVEKKYIDRANRQPLSLAKNKLSLSGSGNLNTGIRSVKIEPRRVRTDKDGKYKRVERKRLSLPDNPKLELETNKISLDERRRRLKLLEKGIINEER